MLYGNRCSPSEGSLPLVTSSRGLPLNRVSFPDGSLQNSLRFPFCVHLQLAGASLSPRETRSGSDDVLE